ncbi:MAG: BatD family protein [Bacteroidia bacterium]
MAKQKHTRNITGKLLCVMGLLFSFSLLSQKINVQVSANRVQVGAAFQVAFSINASPSNYTPPSFKDFDVFSGPNVSQSMQFANGNMSQSYTISFLIAAKKEGKLVIGPMAMNVGGQSIQSAPVTIEAVKGAVQQQQQGNGAAQAQEEPGAVNVSGEEVFIRTTLSKTKCYLGEQVTVTQKVYSRLDLRGFQNVKFPSYNGFWSQQAEGSNNIQLQVENLDGVNYYVGEFSKTYMFPQRSGQLIIEPTELECVVRKQTNKKPRNFFEQFFGSGGFEDVVVKTKSKPVKLEVLPLPEANKPADFSGGVGSLTYKADVNKRNLKANDALNLRITIGGRGNIKLIDPPKLKLPEGFESYEPKVSENVSNASGVSGSKTYDYLVIPRVPGEFTLDNLSFSYFDLDKKQYVTVPSPDIKITVTPGDGKSNASAQVYDHLKQEIKETENDIRYIKKGNFELQKRNAEFFNSAAHILLLILPCLLFVAGLFYRRHYIKQNSNMVAVKGRKAARVAKKQLVVAEKRMKENKKEEFYTEVMTALNNYLSHKLNLPIADLSKDNITKMLQARQVDPGIQLALFDTIQQCEYAKYAPGAVSGDLQAVYTKTVELISSLEDQVKHV